MAWASDGRNCTARTARQGRWFPLLLLAFVIGAGCDRGELAPKGDNAGDNAWHEIRSVDDPAKTSMPPLHQAAWNGREDEAARLVTASPASINRKMKGGRTPLHCAAFRGHAGVVALLLKAGADPRAADDTGRTGLMEAAGNLAATRLLVQAGASVNAADTAGRTALSDAVHERNADVTAYLLSKGADPNTKASLGFGGPASPLYWASQNGDEDLVRLLVRHGADPNACGYYGSVLCVAVCEKHTKVVDFLLTLDIDVNKRGPENRMQAPLHWAAHEGNLPLMALLARKRADLNVRDRDERRPVHYALANNRTDAARWLLSQGARADIFSASSLGDAPAVKAMLDRDAGLLNAADADGYTPLHWAAMGAGTLPTVDLLLAKGADVNARAWRDGQTPLHLAAGRGDEQVVRRMLAAGADGRVKCKPLERTPAEYAERAGHDRIRTLISSWVTGASLPETTPAPRK